MAAPTIDDQLLRDRVRLYFKVMFCVEVAFNVIAGTLHAIGFAPPQEAASHDNILTFRAIAVGLSGLGWLLSARGSLPRAALIGAEVFGTLTLAATYVHLGATLPLYGTAFGFLLVSLVVALRAAVIPSPVLRTVVIGTLALAEPSVMTALTADLPLVVITWLVIVAISYVAVTAVTSNVIYGLRRDVGQAKQMGQYVLHRKLGAGGMGEVYEATHVLLKRPAAIKVLPPDNAGAQTVARFEREVRQTSRLEHPNSVSIYDYGHTPGGQFYYAMEYVRGLDLQKLVVRDGRIGSARVRAILAQAAQALAEAHALGLVHRDVKPANIMLCERAGVPDTVKVLDFGLVKELGGDARSNVTLEGSVVGTPHYLAPEAIREADASVPASDVYALGAVGYFLLAGHEVFDATSIIEVCSKHLTEAPKPLTELVEGVDVALAAILMRCLDKDPARRFADGGALAEALAVLDIEGWTTRDARAWWTTYRTEPETTALSTGPTELAIDLTVRAS